MISKLACWAFGALIVCLPATASATGGLDCGIDDKNVKLEFEALFSYSDIGGLFQIGGTFESKNPKTYKTLRKFDLTGADVRQQWFRDRQLKLMIYRETEGDGVPFAFVKLIIEAEQPEGEDFAYAGTYKLTESQAFTVEGKVGCSAG